MCTCVYLCLDTGVHVRGHVATSPGNDAILSSYVFIFIREGLSVSTRHACQLRMINQLCVEWT